MRKLSVMLLLLLAAACNDDEDSGKYTSINGYWIVRTPDDATSVAFRIGQDADGLFEVGGVNVRHSGTDYNTKPIDARISVISANEIESITIINNSLVAPFFVIRYQSITVNDDYTEMDIEISSYNIDGSFREFSSTRATRN
jgi:hypothetical protein